MDISNEFKWSQRVTKRFANQLEIISQRSMSRWFSLTSGLLHHRKEKGKTTNSMLNAPQPYHINEKSMGLTPCSMFGVQFMFVTFQCLNSNGAVLCATAFVEFAITLRCYYICEIISRHRHEHPTFYQSLFL